MKTSAYALQCTQNTVVGNDVFDFRFTKPKDFTFEAGQFVLFDVPLLDNPEDIQTRAFSIASAPHEEELLFVAKLIEGGRASAWIESRLQAGDTVRTQGPFGRFLLNEENPKEYLFVCTSTGVAPFRSQILHALQNGNTRRMDLIFGARTEEDLFWQQELNELTHTYENLFVHYAVSQPSASWVGHKGRVQTLFSQIAPDLSRKQIYVCGNPAMTDEVKKLCLEEHNVDKSDLHVEGYI